MKYNARIVMTFTLSSLLSSLPFMLFASTTRAAAFSPGIGEPALIGEIRDASMAGPQGPSPGPPVAMTFCLAYGSPTFSVGSPPIPDNVDAYIGCQQVFSSGQTGYVDFDASNTPGFTNFLSYLTNGTDELIWTCDVSLFSDGSVNVPTGSGGGVESGRIDGLNKSPDLIGKDVGFIRLIVNKVNVSTDGSSNSAEWDVVWQFWSGTPLAAGGGQRSDVDDFLLYANPLQESTKLPASTTGFDVTVFYGTTINPSTFAATLNGISFGGFHPVAGTHETVAVPLTQGRNELLLKVDGVRSDGHVATDRDRLIFSVP